MKMVKIVAMVKWQLTDNHPEPTFTVRRSAIGAEALATGHYVRTNAGDELERVRELDEAGEPVRIFKGRDPSKDQSFFLSRITQVRMYFIHLLRCSTTVYRAPTDFSRKSRRTAGIIDWNAMNAVRTLLRLTALGGQMS